MGFKQVGVDPDFLYYPLEEGFIYQPIKEKEVEYIPQEEDKGKVLLIHRPSHCPLSFFLCLPEKGRANNKRDYSRNLHSMDR